MLNDEALSIIHFNSRSLKGNLVKIKELLRQLDKNFKVIAITESWLKDSDINDVQIEGYNMFYVNRVSKKGGGVALYIDYHLKCKIIEQKTIAVENLMELLTVEITNEIGKNMLISCVYRAPGPCVELFTDKILQMFEKIYNKPLILCGDFNIDLGNPSASSEFKNCMKYRSIPNDN